MNSPFACSQLGGDKFLSPTPPPSWCVLRDVRGDDNHDCESAETSPPHATSRVVLRCFRWLSDELPRDEVGASERVNSSCQVWVREMRGLKKDEFDRERRLDYFASGANWPIWSRKSVEMRTNLGATKELEVYFLYWDLEKEYKRRVAFIRW